MKARQRLNADSKSTRNAAGSTVPATAETTPRRPPPSTPKDRRNHWWYFRRMSRFDQMSWVFEIFTATLSIVDVLSDALVAHQFYSEGHLGWFWMVMASVIVSNIVYAFIAMDKIMLGQWGWPQPTDQLGYTKLYLLAFPFAQATPLVLWRHEAFAQWRAATAAIDEAEAGREVRGGEEEEGEPMPREDSWDLDHATGATSAVKEDLEEDDEVRRLIHRLDKGLKSHFDAHLGFYVETLVEAAPQAVIQLLAVSALGGATWIQLSSMCLSLFSIVSKAYIVSVSFDMKAMVFKASLVAFDVFSMFFVFSTLVAQNTPMETTVELLVPSFLGIPTGPTHFSGIGTVTLHVSWLAGYWFQLASWSLLVAVLWFVGLGVHAAFEARCRITQDNWFVPPLLCGGFLTCLFPALLAFEACKMGVLLFALWVFSPPEGRGAFYALTFGFVRKGHRRRGAMEGKTRLHHVLHYAVDNWVRALKTTRHYPRRKLSRSWDSDWTTFAAKLHLLINQDRITPWSYRPVKITMDDTKAPFSLRNYIPRNLSELRSAFVVVCATLSTVFATVSVAFNLAYPFVYVSAYGARHLDLLQGACLVFLTLSLCLIVALGPHMYRFAMFSFILTSLFKVCMQGTTNAKHATECISTYYTPPHVAVLKAAVSVEVLPRELVDTVGEYLSACDVDFSTLTVEQCAELRDRSVET